MKECICPKCKNTRIILGRYYNPKAIAKSQGGHPWFEPKGLKKTFFSYFSFSASSVSLENRSKFCACLDCGFIWSKVYLEDLHKLMQRVEKKHNTNKCPGCLKKDLIEGATNIVTPRFRPKGLRFFCFSSDIKLKNDNNFEACLNCGLIFSEFECNALYELLLKKGTKKTKANYNIL